MSHFLSYYQRQNLQNGTSSTTVRVMVPSFVGCCIHKGIENIDHNIGCLTSFWHSKNYIRSWIFLQSIKSHFMSSEATNEKFLLIAFDQQSLGTATLGGKRACHGIHHVVTYNLRSAYSFGMVPANLLLLKSISTKLLRHAQFVGRGPISLFVSCFGSINKSPVNKHSTLFNWESVGNFSWSAYFQASIDVCKIWLESFSFVNAAST